MTLGPRVVTGHPTPAHGNPSAEQKQTISAHTVLLVGRSEFGEDTVAHAGAHAQTQKHAHTREPHTLMETHPHM